MQWKIIFAGLKARPVRSWAIIFIIALQAILLSIVRWYLTLSFSSLVILFSMYANITERTREIGILRSLGASKKFIAALILKEALVVSLFGILLGFAVVFTVAGAEAFDNNIVWTISSAILISASCV